MIQIQFEYIGLVVVQALDIASLKLIPYRGGHDIVGGGRQIGGVFKRYIQPVARALIVQDIISFPSPQVVEALVFKGELCLAFRDEGFSDFLLGVGRNAVIAGARRNARSFADFFYAVDSLAFMSDFVGAFGI